MVQTHGCQVVCAHTDADEVLNFEAVLAVGYVLIHLLPAPYTRATASDVSPAPDHSSISVPLSGDLRRHSDLAALPCRGIKCRAPDDKAR